MQNRQYKTEGIILKRQDIGEADRLLTVFSQKFGKMRCVAKGSRRPTSRKASSIEVFTRSLLVLAKGKNLDILTQTEAIETFPTIRIKLRAAKAAFHAIELIDLLTAEHEEQTSIFDLLSETLRLINNQGFATLSQMTDFETQLLGQLGFGTPAGLGMSSTQDYIETIIERRLRTIQIFKSI